MEFMYKNKKIKLHYDIDNNILNLKELVQEYGIGILGAILVEHNIVLNLNSTTRTFLSLLINSISCQYSLIGIENSTEQILNEINSNQDDYSKDIEEVLTIIEEQQKEKK